MPLDLTQHFASGAKAVNGWCALPSPVTAEIMGRQGFDLMTVDLQHGLIDYQMALTILQVLQGLPARSWCACPGTNPAS
jgi:4-hydroxy-2-oxoheptanedioate aldolase